jgi:hypothetical protein
MTELACRYGDDRDAAIVAFLYDEPDASPAERAGFEAHLRSCAQCQADIADLRGVRAQMGHWSPPEPSFTIRHPQSAVRNPQWWSAIPAWAQVAAALLFLGVSAGIANLDVRYNQNGLSVRTGWSANRPAETGATQPAAQSATAAAASGAGAPTDAPWRSDLAALERQLKGDIHAAQTQSPAGSVPSVRAVSATVSDAEVTRRVRAIVEESEKRQQRELALRLAELARDVTAQRQADMVKIDRTLGLVQNNVGIEVMKNREKMNQMDLIYRASQRQ